MDTPAAKWRQIALLLASTLTVMAGATISPSLPAMTEQFPAQPLLVRLVLTLPALFIGISAPLAGGIVDRFGRRRVLLAGTLLYGIAGGSGFVAPTLPLLLLGRALLGIAVGGIQTSVTTLIADYFAGDARSRGLGLQSGVMGFGASIFLTVGGQLANLGWRFPFLVYLAALVMLPLLIAVVDEPDADVRRQQAEASAAVPVPVLLIGVLCAVMLVSQVGFYMIPVYLPFHLTALLDASPAQSGLAIGALTFIYALTATNFGRIAARVQRVVLLGVGFGLMAAGMGLIAAGQTYLAIYPGLVMQGIGLGFMIPNLNVWMAGGTPPAIRGRALGALTMSMWIGRFLTPVITQPIVDAQGLAAAFGVVAAISALLVPVLALGYEPLRRLGSTA
ncbi:MAG: MFS transporter [Anaerolineae bacterium]